MQRLRRAPRLARLVLAWFALTLGVAVAAPVLDPQGLAWLCTASAADGRGGSTGQNGGGMAFNHGLHCPLCASPAAPPPAPLATTAIVHGGMPLAAPPRTSPPPSCATRPHLARGPPHTVLS